MHHMNFGSQTYLSLDSCHDSVQNGGVKTSGALLATIIATKNICPDTLKKVAKFQKSPRYIYIYDVQIRSGMDLHGYVRIHSGMELHDYVQICSGMDLHGYVQVHSS